MEKKHIMKQNSLNMHAQRKKLSGSGMRLTASMPSARHASVSFASRELPREQSTVPRERSKSLTSPKNASVSHSIESLSESSVLALSSTSLASSTLMQSSTSVQLPTSAQSPNLVTTEKDDKDMMSSTLGTCLELALNKKYAAEESAVHLKGELATAQERMKMLENVIRTRTGKLKSALKTLTATRADQESLQQELKLVQHKKNEGEKRNEKMQEMYTESLKMKNERIKELEEDNHMMRNSRASTPYCNGFPDNSTRSSREDLSSSLNLDHRTFRRRTLGRTPSDASLSWNSEWGLSQQDVEELVEDYGELRQSYTGLLYSKNERINQLEEKLESLKHKVVLSSSSSEASLIHLEDDASFLNRFESTQYGRQAPLQRRISGHIRADRVLHPARRVSLKHQGSLGNYESKEQVAHKRSPSLPTPMASRTNGMAVLDSETVPDQLLSVQRQQDDAFTFSLQGPVTPTIEIQDEENLELSEVAETKRKINQPGKEYQTKQYRKYSQNREHVYSSSDRASTRSVTPRSRRTPSPTIPVKVLNTIRDIGDITDRCASSESSVTIDIELESNDDYTTSKQNSHTCDQNESRLIKPLEKEKTEPNITSSEVTPPKQQPLPTLPGLTKVLSSVPQWKKMFMQRKKLSGSPSNPPSSQTETEEEIAMPQWKKDLLAKRKTKCKESSAETLQRDQ